MSDTGTLVPVATALGGVSGMCSRGPICVFPLRIILLHVISNLSPVSTLVSNPHTSNSIRNPSIRSKLLVSCRFERNIDVTKNCLMKVIHAVVDMAYVPFIEFVLRKEIFSEGA